MPNEVMLSFCVFRYQSFPSGKTLPTYKYGASPEPDQCPLCDKLTGKVYSCEAGCGRAFHLKCVGLTAEPPPPWYCFDCMRANPELQTLPTAQSYEPPKDPSTMTTEEKMEAICDFLEEYRDTRGRQVAELFLELPSREEYADYFQLIQNAISFTEIRQKKYSTPLEFRDDVLLMVKNAQTYNVPKSEVYRDSQTLERLFNTQMSKYFSDLPPMVTPKKRGRAPKSQTPTPATPPSATSTPGVALTPKTEDGHVEVDIEGEGETPISPEAEDEEGRDPKKRKASYKARDFTYYDELDDEEDEDAKSKPLKKEIVEGEEGDSIEKILGDRVTGVR